MSKYTDDDYCDECRLYGDDYYIDEDGEWISACDKCPFNKYGSDDDE